jgi:CD63 antigen
LSIIFILELAAGITGYVLRNSTYALITDALKPTMPEYINPNKTHIAYGWDNIQETYKCCGLETNEVRGKRWVVTDAIEGFDEV